MTRKSRVALMRRDNQGVFPSKGGQLCLTRFAVAGRQLRLANELERQFVGIDVARSSATSDRAANGRTAYPGFGILDCWRRNAEKFARVAARFWRTR